MPKLGVLNMWCLSPDPWNEIAPFKPKGFTFGGPWLTKKEIEAGF